MKIEERKKKYGQGRTFIKTKKRLPINFDVASLDLMCQYTISSNRNIKRGAFINLRNLVELLDMERYINDQERYRRVLFIKKSLEARLEKGLTNPITIIKYTNGGLIDDDIINIDEFSELSNKEIDWINETVSNTLSLTFLYEEIDRGLDLFTRFKAADSSNISKLGKEIEEYIAMLNTMFRQAKVQSVTNETFSLKGDSLRNTLESVHSELKSEYRKLITGMQGFNQLIGGGFENTRCYLFLGITGVGKSLSLLNIAYQMKKYNKGFKPKDPTKIPCIVYLTMENTVTETVDRLFKISTGMDIRDTTPEEAERILRTTGELYLTEDSPIDLIIKYQPNRSVDTGYLYTLVEDLEDEGYEVICMIQDHVKRIRSVNNNPDVRLELGDVINEMKTFAILKDIPMITVSHLNREGARIIDSGTSTRTKSDLTRLLGKSNIGESLLMLDNVDYGGILNVEYDIDGMKYMAFKNIKQRFGSMRDYIAQPFSADNDIKLIEDVFAPIPVFKDSIYETSLRQATEQNRTQTKIKQSGYSNIPNYDDDDNIYEFSKYSSDNIQESTTKTYVPSVGGGISNGNRAFSYIA
jgi:hypothetical protein